MGKAERLMTASAVSFFECGSQDVAVLPRIFGRGVEARSAKRGKGVFSWPRFTDVS
jgi:hypothetical protein